MTSAALTVPAGTVASTLTGFVTRVDLSAMPADWWASVEGSGANIRVRQGGSVIPFDVVACDSGAEAGELFFKATLTTGDNVFSIDTDSGAAALAATDPNGRNAVWSDYLAVVLGQALINRVTGSALTLEGTLTAASSGMLAFDGSNGARVNGLAKHTSWTMGASAIPTSLGSSRGVCHYNDSATTASDARGTIAHDASPNRWGLWNSTDTWLYSGADPVSGTRVRLAATHDGTTARKLYMNGVATTDSTVAARPGLSGNAFQIGTRGGATSASRWIGSIGYLYLRSGVLSADWLAAERVSWETPTSFYVTEGTTLDVWDGSAVDQVAVLGVWDGSAVDEVVVLGVWDGTAVDPVET